MTPSASTLLCLQCGLEMSPRETVAHPAGAAQLELYECEPCRRRAVITFEHRDLTSDEESWVEREVAARGSFFPTDFSVRGHGRFGR